MEFYSRSVPAYESYDAVSGRDGYVRPRSGRLHRVPHLARLFIGRRGHGPARTHARYTVLYFSVQQSERKILDVIL